MAFLTALSGLNASQTSISVTSNNIANVGTIGFHGARAEFGDVYSNSLFSDARTQIGSGTRLNRVAQDFGQGSLATTSNSLDLALSGSGFFQLMTTGDGKDRAYTRAGAFMLDAQGYVVNAAGAKLASFPTALNGTPLHGVIASLELLDVTALSQDNKTLIQTARHCSDRALLQINEILDLIRLGENREPDSPFAPEELVRSIVLELTPLAKEKGNVIRLQVSGMTGGRYVGAPSAFARAIYNLAGNAVKFTQDGTITVSLDFQPAWDGGTRLSVAVADTGIGIAPEDQHRIFEEFETLESGGSNVGTGLGLAIAKMAITRLGGNLQLESQLGKGSRFFFDVTLEPDHTVAEDSAVLPVEHEDHAGAVSRVLLVDDNQVNRTLMARMVERLGHQVETACNGREAVDMAAATHYDLILMDVSMPVMNGLEATRAIRKSGASRNTVILGVTALVSRDDPELRSCGMQEVLGKPMKLGDLEAAFARHLALEDDYDADDWDEDEDGDGEDGADPMQALSVLVGHETAHALVRQCFEDASLALESLRDTTLEAAERARVIHSAVGSTGLVGLRLLSDVLSRAERAVLSEGPLDVSALADELAEEITAARAFFGSAA
jgi:CheY-like chemotaxis protein